MQSQVSASTGENADVTTHAARVLYRYNVKQVPLTGTRVAYGDCGSSDDAHARSIANRYPKGASVTVYYMPGKPEECLLELGVHLQTWFIFLFGVAFVGVGGFWMRPPIVAMAKRA